MDPRPLYPNMYHPIVKRRNRNFEGQAKHYTRTARPTKYYIIDFGISRKYKPSDAPFLEPIIRGGDKSVPEFQSSMDGICDPFPTDVYFIGSAVNQKLLQVSDPVLSFPFMHVPIIIESNT